MLSLVTALTLYDPKRFVVLRGNHEDKWQNMKGDDCFWNELKGRNYSENFFQKITHMYQRMPLCALVNREVFCAHGGIAKGIESLSDFNAIRRPVNLSSQYVDDLAFQMCWNDPMVQHQTWRVSPRSTRANLFGWKAARDVMASLGVSYIVRGHEFQPNGFQSLFRSKLITIHSSAHYMGHPDCRMGYVVVHRTEHGRICIEIHSIDPEPLLQMML